MGEFEIILEHYLPRKTIIKIKCGKCPSTREVRVEAVYRQLKRGRDCYLCPSCAGKQGWTTDNKIVASQRAKSQWEDPSYAGVIIGRAAARGIASSINKKEPTTPNFE